MTKTQYLMASLLKVVNVLTFAMVSILLKFKVSSVPSLQQFVCIYGLGAAMLFPVIMYWLPVQKLKVKQIKNYGYRAILTLIAMSTFLESLKFLDPVHATIFVYLTPITTSALGVFLLHEKVDIRWFMSLLLAALGILIAFHRSFEVKSTLHGMILAIFSAITWAFWNFICKKNSSDDHHLIQVFYTFILASLLLSPMVMLHWAPMTWEHYTWLAIIAVLGIISVTCLFLAYKLAPISMLAPHGYLKIVFTSIMMFFIAGKGVSLHLGCGIALIILSNVILLDHSMNFIKNLLSKMRILHKMFNLLGLAEHWQAFLIPYNRTDATSSAQRGETPRAMSRRASRSQRSRATSAISAESLSDAEMMPIFPNRSPNNDAELIFSDFETALDKKEFNFASQNSKKSSSNNRNKNSLARQDKRSKGYSGEAESDAPTASFSEEESMNSSSSSSAKANPN